MGGDTSASSLAWTKFVLSKKFELRNLFWGLISGVDKRVRLILLIIIIFLLSIRIILFVLSGGFKFC